MLTNWGRNPAVRDHQLGEPVPFSQPTSSLPANSICSSFKILQHPISSRACLCYSPPGPQAQVITMAHHRTAIPCYLAALFSPCSEHLFSTHSLELLFQHVSPRIPLCLKPSNDSSVTRSQLKVLWGLLGPGTLCVTPAIHSTLPYSFCDLLSCHPSLCHSATTSLASWPTLQ